MTSHELAHLLLSKPDLRVMVDGYEGGFKDIDPSHVVMTEIVHDSLPVVVDCYGPHEEARFVHKEGKSVILALVITRYDDRE